MIIGGLKRKERYTELRDSDKYISQCKEEVNML